MNRLRPPAILNWAGSKIRVGQFLATAGLPPFSAYHEPFLGSAAVFFALSSAGLIAESYLSDANPRLINLFRAVKEKPDQVLSELDLHALLDSDVHFSAVLSRLNNEPCNSEADSAVAAAMVYLLTQSFHSTWYETKEGLVSMGRRSAQRRFKPRRQDVSRAAVLLGEANLQVEDYSSALDRARSGDLVFIDPPYLYAGDAADQQAYNADRFTDSDLEILLERLAVLSGAGAGIVFCWGEDISSSLPLNWSMRAIGRDYVWLSAGVTA